MIKKWRQDRGLSLGDLARRAGTSAATLSRYERGWQRFELYTLEKIATALGCQLVVSFERLPRRRHPANMPAVLKRLGRLFWDQHLSKKNFMEHPRWVAERVLEYGSLDDVLSLISIMGKHRFLNIASRCRFQSKKTQHFWKHMLAQEGMPCMKKSYQREPWLS